MDTAQKRARSGGPALVEAMKFVTICRALDTQNDYPHIGDLQWWCRDGSLAVSDIPVSQGVCNYCHDETMAVVRTFLSRT